MPKFVLIDHSLKDAGGHHFEYALQVLSAAETAGYEVILATHRRFSSRGRMPGHWTIFPLFYHDTYSHHCLYFAQSYRNRGPKGAPTTSRASRRSWNKFGRVWSQRSRRRHLDRFSQSCAQLFHDVTLSTGDQVFFATLSEFDMKGLTEYLHQTPASRVADWHLQFHFDVFSGRESDYERQGDRIELMRERFKEMLPDAAEHRVHFYNTTEPLSDQYKRLGVASFQPLPYPVNSEFRPRTQRQRPNQPLRVTCAGHLRREKGKHHLVGLVEQLWPDLLSNGKVQLVVQSNPAQMRRLLPRRLRRLLDGASLPQPPIARAPHPLDAKSYQEFVRNADVGLFLYDGARYYSRCSGILLEMLSAGVPVIVPAGCWLEDQIAEPNYQYLDQLTEGDSALAGGFQARTAKLAATGWQTELDVSVRDKAQQLLFECSWKPTHSSATHLRVRATSIDSAGRPSQHPDSILSRRSGSRSAKTLFTLARNTNRVRIEVSNAFDSASCDLHDLKIRFLDGSNVRGPIALGALGRSAAEIADIPALLNEIVEHHDHYRERTVRFSKSYRDDHDASWTVRQLEQNSTVDAVEGM